MKFFIGFDRKEAVVYQVAAHSLRKTTPEAEIIPLIQDELRAKGIYDREDKLAATDFSLTRFLVPYLTGYKGWAVFVDCDFLFTRNVRNALQKYLHPGLPLYAVKHEYTPRTQTKMGGVTQHRYPKKNWSSFMLFDCGHEANKLLRLDTVNTMPASWLHQFGWLDGWEIGELDPGLNFLVGEYDPPEESADLEAATDLTPTCLHFTLGIGPYLPPVPDYVKLWQASCSDYIAERDYQKDKEHGRRLARRMAV